MDSELSSWAETALGFVPKDKRQRDAFVKLMCGPLSSKWEHLMRCVRSSEEACHIRGNLKLAAANRARNRGERTTVADVTSATSNDTVSVSGFLSGRDELMAEYKAAEKELRIIRKRTLDAETSGRQHAIDARTLLSAAAEAEARSVDARRHSALLAVQECKARARGESIVDVKGRIEKFADGDLFRLKHNEGEYAVSDDGATTGQVKNAAEFAIDRASSRAKKLLEAALTDPSQVTQEMREDFQRETTDLFRSIGAREIQAALAAEIRAATDRVSESAAQLDIPSDAERMRSELETSGSLSSALNPRGTFKPLYDRIVDLAEMHVESSKAAEKLAAMAAEEREGAEETSDKLKEMLVQKVPTSPHLRDLLLRLVNLESVAARGRAIVAALTEATEAGEKSVARGEAAAEAELAKHRAQVEEQEEEISKMWLQIGSALSANKAFYSTELAKLMSEVESEVRDTLLPMESELRSAAEGSEDGEARQLSMLKEWTGNLDALRTTRIKSAADKRVSVMRTVSLSTNRLHPSTNASNTGVDSLVNSALARFDLLPESSPMAMLARAAEARVEVSALAEWLELAKRDEGRETEAVKRCEEGIQKLCVDLVGHDDGLQREVLPLLEAEATRLESGKRAVKRAEDAIAVWRDEPGQDAISADPDFSPDAAMVLRKYQDRFRVALARWQQLTAAA